MSVSSYSLNYLSSFVPEASMAAHIVWEFNLERLFAITYNMGFQTFVLASGKRNALAKQTGFKVSTRAEADLSNICDLDCTDCYMPKENPQIIKPGLLEKFVVGMQDIGIYALLVFGGEPFLPQTRKILLESAKKHRNIEYIVCTNAQNIDETVVEELERLPNIIPVVSLDGLRKNNDERRGEGVFDKAVEVMDALSKRRIFYGISVTVTKQNISEVGSDDFFKFLDSHNCRVIYYRRLISSFSEYQPSTEEFREFLLQLREKRASRYGIHTLGGEIRNPQNPISGPSQNHTLHLTYDGKVIYNRFGPVLGDLKNQSLFEIQVSPRTREVVMATFARDKNTVYL